jgi:hypothetical protein
MNYYCSSVVGYSGCSFGWWLVLICSERKYYWLVVGLFRKVLLMVDKPDKQSLLLSLQFVQILGQG